jgi:hypothetical protein
MMIPRVSAIPGAMYKESVRVGETYLTEAQVQRVFHSMHSDFSGPSYNLLEKNCNHFSEAFLERLLFKGNGKPASDTLTPGMSARPPLPIGLHDALETE